MLRLIWIKLKLALNLEKMSITVVKIIAIRECLVPEFCFINNVFQNSLKERMLKLFVLNDVALGRLHIDSHATLTGVR